MSIEFREWLLIRLCATRYATHFTDDDVDVVARRLGVQPDLLREARAEVMLDRVAGGRRTSQRNARQIDIFMPPIIFKAWKAECEARGIDGATLLRSTIHDYLLNRWEPKDVLPYWRFEGKRYRCGRFESEFPRERSEITTGAWRALGRRADAHGASRAALIRALIQEILAGGFRTVPLVPAGKLFDDEERYVT